MKIPFLLHFTTFYSLEILRCESTHIAICWHVLLNVSPNKNNNLHKIHSHEHAFEMHRCQLSIK